MTDTVRVDQTAERKTAADGDLIAETGRERGPAVETEAEDTDRAAEIEKGGDDLTAGMRRDAEVQINSLLQIRTAGLYECIMTVCLFIRSVNLPATVDDC